MMTATRVLGPACVAVALVLLMTGNQFVGQLMLFLGGAALAAALIIRIVSPPTRRARSGSLPHLVYAVVWTVGALLALAILIFVFTQNYGVGEIFAVAGAALACLGCSFMALMFFVAWFQIRRHH